MNRAGAQDMFAKVQMSFKIQVEILELDTISPSIFMVGVLTIFFSCLIFSLIYFFQLYWCVIE